MRKFFSILLVSVLLAVPSYAQLGIGAGYLNQSLSEFNPHLLNGFYAGFGYDISLGSRFSITPGLYYLRSQGGLYETGNLWLTITHALPGPVKEEKEYFRNNSLLLPVQVSFSFIKSPVFRLFLAVGPSLSYELNTSYEYSCSNREGSCKDLLSGSETLKPTIDYSRWSIGIGGGIGMDIFKHYRITAGYEYGLNNRLNGREYHTLQDDKSMHTQRIHLGVSYVF